MMVHRSRLPKDEFRRESLLQPSSRLAQMLALAHLIEDRIQCGEVSSYSEAARNLNVTRARVSQILRLLGLAAPIQEAILMGTSNATERRVRAICQLPSWEDQLAEWVTL